MPSINVCTIRHDFAKSRQCFCEKTFLPAARGGLPEFSFNIIAGAPGSGKTTLAHQFAFANATPERPALYFTVLGESAIKMLRYQYQQQYTFFDPNKVPNSVRFVNLSQVVLEKDLGAVLQEITKEVEKSNAAVVVVDSFRTMVRKPQSGLSEMELQSFIQRLPLSLASWQATTFPTGEYAADELRDNPIFTVADGLFWLRQTAGRNSVIRKLQIVKLRGQASVCGQMGRSGGYASRRKSCSSGRDPLFRNFRDGSCLGLGQIEQERRSRPHTQNVSRHGSVRLLPKISSCNSRVTQGKSPR
jgi:circadian clock protein KaiC